MPILATLVFASPALPAAAQQAGGATASTPAGVTRATPFDDARFAAAQKEGRAILVTITAPWCPTCAAQKPILERLTTQPDFKDLVVFNVDFDTQMDVVGRFGAQAQSTLIAFHGARETARSLGDTNAASIEKLLRSTMG